MSSMGRDVEIHTFEAEHDRGRETARNAQAVAVPATLYNLQDGEPVRFWNMSPYTLKIWIPVDCLDGISCDRIETLAPNSSAAVEGFVNRAAFKRHGGIVRYQVFCEEVGRFAVGNSPPKMKIGNIG